MKPTAILVNTGRGALVERDALLAALQGAPDHGRRPRRVPPGAARARRPDPALPNVICSPHNAGQTPEVIRDGLLAAVDNVERFLAGKPGNLVVSPIR